MIRVKQPRLHRALKYSALRQFIVQPTSTRESRGSMNRSTARPPSMGQELGIYPNIVFSWVQLDRLHNVPKHCQIKSTIFVYFDVISPSLSMQRLAQKFRGSRKLS